jgi:hypothetical protein
LVDWVAVACPRIEHGERTPSLRDDQTLAGSYASQITAQVLPELAYTNAILHSTDVARL